MTISGDNPGDFSPGVENLDPMAIGPSSRSEGYSYRTPDQAYLVGRIRENHPEWDALRVGAITWINNKFGEYVVTEALRVLHGAMPAQPIEKPLAYLVAVCERVSREAS